MVYSLSKYNPVQKMKVVNFKKLSSKKFFQSNGIEGIEMPVTKDQH